MATGFIGPVVVLWQDDGDAKKMKIHFTIAHMGMYKPSDGLTNLEQWAPDETIRHKILVDNPQWLFDFLSKRGRTTDVFFRPIRKPALADKRASSWRFRACNQ
jgi:hypothetical protein